MIPYFLANGLADRGFDVSVITSGPNRAIRRENLNGVKIYRFFSPNLYWVKNKDQYSSLYKGIWQIIDTWNPFVYLTLRKLFLEIQPDIIHVHKLRGISPAVWSAGTGAGVTPIVHTTHDFELISPEATLLTKIGQLANERHWLFRPYQSLRASFSKSVHYWSAPSEFAIGKHKRFGFFPNTDGVVVPNTHGLPLSKLRAIQDQSEQWKSDSEDFKFLFIGRLEKEKGIFVLCDSFIEVNKLNLKTKLIICGSGTQAETLRQKYQHPKIEFVGHVEGKEKEHNLKNSDVVVVPSIWEEVFGIVIVESYAYGKPVIASSIGGMKELVVEGKTGFLVEPGNREELAKVMLNSADHSNEIRKLAQKCYVEGRKYSIEVFLRDYLNLYAI